MKLTSMTDFVLEREKERNVRLEYSSFDFRDNVVKYANFLKQPLTLGMFVPCDDLGNVLILGKNTCQYDFEVEQQAKERCLFEGFKLSALSNETVKIVFNNDGCQIRFGIKTTISLFESITIEDVTKYSKSNITLTPAAIKQL